MTWHGYPSGWDEFIDLTWTDRWFALLELSELIERSNEQGGGRPEGDRR